MTADAPRRPRGLLGRLVRGYGPPYPTYLAIAEEILPRTFPHSEYGGFGYWGWELERAFVQLHPAARNEVRFFLYVHWGWGSGATMRLGRQDAPLSPSGNFYGEAPETRHLVRWTAVHRIARLLQDTADAHGWLPEPGALTTPNIHGTLTTPTTASGNLTTPEE